MFVSARVSAAVALRWLVLAMVIATAALALSAPAAEAQVDFSHWTVTHWLDNAADVKWAPDGARIAFTRKVTVSGKVYDHIFTANPDGSNPVDLMPDWTSQNDTPDWSADSTKIVWVSDNSTAFDIGGAGGGPGVDLWVMHADGSTKTRLTTGTPGATNYRPYWSHSGSMLLWTQGWWRIGADDFRWELHVANYVDDAGGGHLDNDHVVNASDTAFYEGSEWTPDDSGILYASTKSNSGNYELYRLDLSTGTETRLTYNPEIDISGHPSPDGQWIAFTSSRDDHSTWSYYTDVSWDLNIPPLLDETAILIAEDAVAWSQPFNPQATDIFMMKPDGSGVTQLTDWRSRYDEAAGGMADWAPDGCHLATSPTIAPALISGQRQLINVTKTSRVTWLITFSGCSAL